MAVLVCLVLFLAMTGQSSALYCLCKDGVSDQVLQKSLDYACGAGADCSAIIQSGACYQPNTVKSHCDYAVNSYFQKKGQIAGSCDFAGTATTSANPPTTVANGCTYASSANNTGTTTSPTTPTTTPSTTPTTTPSTTIGGTPTTTGGNTTGTPTSSVFPGSGTTTGLGPTSMDPNGGVALLCTNLFLSFALTFWFSGLLLLWG